MDAIRELVSGDELAKIIKLPKRLRGRQVEIIVMPARASDTNCATNKLPRLSRQELDDMKRVSSAIELTGAIPHPYMTAADIRKERLFDRYGSAN